MKKLSMIVAMAMLIAAACSQAAPPASKTEMAPPASTAPATLKSEPPTPAVPAAPAPATQLAEKATSYESARYTNEEYGFSVRYPSSWAAWKPPLATLAFFASEKIQQPDRMTVAVDIRPAENFKEASRNFIAEMIKWKASDAMYIPIADLVYEKTAQLADGKTVAYDQCWAIASYRAYCYGIMKDGKAITVASGWDESGADLYEEIVHTLTLVKSR